MDHRETIRSMLNNLIHDRSEEATLDFHNVIVAKMKDVSGISTTEVQPETVDTDVTDVQPAETTETE